jgi:hypothetical protein
MDDLVRLIAQQIDSKRYYYPAFRINVSRQTGDIVFGSGLRGEFFPSEANTDSDLDMHHNSLLKGTDASSKLAGLASIIYWGFATSGDNRARRRVKWFLEGHQAQTGVTPTVAKRCVEQASAFAGMGAFGEALGTIGQMPQLGRTPFASKVIAFLDPERSGVYDNRIMEFLPQSHLLAATFADSLNGVGSVKLHSVKRKYDAWCSKLREIAERVNSCRPDLKVRALDVERAIFGLTKTVS